MAGLVALLWLWGASAMAAPGLPDGLEAGERGRVRQVIDGDTVVLADGTEVRLVGIQAPKLPLDRPQFVAWPLAEDAKTALERLAENQEVTLHYGGRRIDRHGRRLAHLVGSTGRWFQGEMLERGLARVYTFADNRAAVPQMLAIEREARVQNRGIWGHPYYRILTPDDAGRHLDTFQLVEGRVLEAAVVRDRVFLNFGPDWRTDFTIQLDAAARRAFARDGLDPKSFEGMRVRVRGWIKSHNGPLIEATHPEQIETLGR